MSDPRKLYITWIMHGAVFGILIYLVPNFLFLFILTKTNISAATSNIEDTESESEFSLATELDKYVDKRDSMLYEYYPGAEAIEYDFVAERVNYYNTNMVEATAHLIKGCLGAGILNMHVGYMYGGLWTSLMATFIIGPVLSYCMLMLVNSAQKMYVRLRMPRLTYADLAEAAVATAPWKPLRRFSKTFRYTVDTSLFIKMCGSCCAYEIMIAITVKQALESVSPYMKDMNLNERVYIVMVIAPLLLLCLVRNLKYLAPFSLVADVFVAIGMLAAMYFTLYEMGSIYKRPAWKDFHGLLRFCGVYLFSVDVTGITMAVENNMRKPLYFPVVLQYGMSFVIISVTITGFFGYWGWGEDCHGPITIHMPPSTVPIILQFVMAIMLCIVFAVHLWVPFRLAWYYIGRKYKRKRGIWERFYRLLYVFLITCLSVAFPYLSVLTIFVGMFFVALTGFIFPAIIESFVTWNKTQRGVRWRLIKNIFLILIGLFLSGASFYASVVDISVKE